MSQTIVKKERAITAEIPLKSRAPLVELIRSVPNDWERIRATLLRKTELEHVDGTNLSINLSYPGGITASLTGCDSSKNYPANLLTVLFNDADPRTVELFMNRSASAKEGMALQKAVAEKWARKQYVGSFRMLRKQLYEQFPSPRDPSPEAVTLDVKGVVRSDDEILRIRAEWFIGIGGKKENLWWIVKALTRSNIQFVNGRNYEIGRHSEEDSRSEASTRKYLMKLVDGLAEGIDKNSLRIYVASHGFATLDDVRDFLVDSMFGLQYNIEAHGETWKTDDFGNSIGDLKRQIALIDGLNEELAKR